MLKSAPSEGSFNTDWQSAGRAHDVGMTAPDIAPQAIGLLHRCRSRRQAALHTTFANSLRRIVAGNPSPRSGSLTAVDLSDNLRSAQRQWISVRTPVFASEWPCMRVGQQDHVEGHKQTDEHTR